jgi:hypothetical protein
VVNHGALIQNIGVIGDIERQLHILQAKIGGASVPPLRRISRTRTYGQTLARVALSGQSCDPAEIEPFDDVVAFQFVDRIGRDNDLAMDNDVTAISDADRLIEILFCHEHG